MIKSSTAIFFFSCRKIMFFSTKQIFSINKVCLFYVAPKFSFLLFMQNSVLNVLIDGATLLDLLKLKFYLHKLTLFLNPNSLFSDIFPRALFILNTSNLQVHLFLQQKTDQCFSFVNKYSGFLKRKKSGNVDILRRFCSVFPSKHPIF